MQTANTYASRFTKFAYVFWSFTGLKEFTVDRTHSKLVFKESEKSYRYERMNRLSFYFFKFLPALFVFAIIFSRYDFYLADKERLLSHIVAIMATSFFILSNGIIRIIFLSLAACFSVGIAFYIGNLFLPAFVIKYICLYYVIIIVLTDHKYIPYKLIDERGKVVSNFLFPKDLDKDDNEN